MMSGTNKARPVPADRVLMIVNDTTIQGSTRLQKYGFLLSKQYGWELKSITDRQPELEFYGDWKPYWYGPYSEDLAADVQKCVENGTVLKVLVDSMQNKYRYSLTIRGRVAWRSVLSEFPEEMSAIGSKIRNLQKIGLETLLSGVYAAYPEFTTRSVIGDRLG